MRLGLDYGGTKIEGIVLDADGTERARARVPTPRFDYEGGLETIRGLLARLEAEAGGRIESVGIGVPGSVDRTSGYVSKGNSTWLHGRDLRGDLTRMLDRPVKIANDANCFALSEAVDGGGAGAEVVFGVILGTGVGGGVVVHGRLVEGVNAIGGEWGHIPLPAPRDDERPGPVCSCGIAGHVEAWLSGPSFAADYARRAGMPVGIAPERPGDRRPAPPPATPTAEETLRRYEDRLGRSLAVVVNILDPDVIVLGGGLSNVSRLYETVPAADPAARLRRQVQHPPRPERPRRQLRRPRRRLALAPHSKPSLTVVPRLGQRQTRPPGVRRPPPHRLDHRRDRRLRPDQHRRHRPVRLVPHPAAQPEPPRLALRPAAVPHPLHPPGHPHCERPVRHQNGTSAANSTQAPPSGWRKPIRAACSCSRSAALGVAVERVAEDRVPDRREMHPELVAAPGQRPQLQPRRRPPRAPATRQSVTRRLAARYGRPSASAGSASRRSAAARSAPPRPRPRPATRAT